MMPIPDSSSELKSVICEDSSFGVETEMISARMPNFGSSLSLFVAVVSFVFLPVIVFSLSKNYLCFNFRIC